MKAFLLAAGLGTRLKPITNSIPKCLVPICGKPLLGWWIELFKKHGIDEVLINLHHFPERVKEYLEKNSYGIKFVFFYEENLLGSAGTLRENKNFVKNEKEFFILYADNLTNVNLSEFLRFHILKNNNFSLGLFKSNNPSACGIALMNEENVVTDFEEKPKNPKSNLASAGVFLSAPNVLDLIPQKEITDIGFDLIPKLVNNMKGWLIHDYLIDIGTHENLKNAEMKWSSFLKNNQEI
ncbi:MAG TPA: nucleotidyltransferase family protein [Ignavibacteriaceae bacterium]|nr:nucleotidyltransferase family protein [Ignavibacteriaceae bacterium]